MILFEDNHILVAEKLAGQLTQETDLEPRSLTSDLKALIKKRDKKPGNVFLHAVHRLDKPVSGIVLFAKTSKALSRLNANMREKSVKKIYTARVEGSPPVKGELKDYLLKGDFKTQVVSKNIPGAKLAHLKFYLKDGFLYIELLTGRYHQIRAQLSNAGFPILGDSKYEARNPYNKEGIALHHSELTITHPVFKKVQTFCSEVRLGTIYPHHFLGG